MGRFLARRLAWSMAALVIFVTVTFLGVSALPYDYAARYGMGCPACAAEAAEALGLTRPLWAQYLDFMGELATGSLGTSFAGVPVSEALTGHAMWVTLLIFGFGAVIAFLLGAWLGRLAAWRAGATTGVLNTAAILGFAIFPPFLVFLLLRWSDTPMRALRSLLGTPADERHVWVAGTWTETGALKLVGATLLVAVVAGVVLRAVARRRRWPGWTATAVTPATLGLAVASWAAVGAWQPAMTVLFHAPRYAGGGGGMGGGFQGAGGQGGGNVFLAIVGFVILAFGEILLVVEASMDAETDEDYILTAHAKGLADTVVRNRHAARNAVLPALSRFVVGLPLLLTGLIIAERELEIPGLSTVFFNAAQAADLPLVTGALVTFGMLTIGARLVLEVVLAAVDPRIRTRGHA